MKHSKMAAVRELLSCNPDASPAEIVTRLAKKKLAISEGVASNYKSVIKSGAKRKGKKSKKAKRVALAGAVPVQKAAQVRESAPASNGAKSHGLDPNVIGLLKAGRTLGWKKVQSIVELMLEG